MASVRRYRTAKGETRYSVRWRDADGQEHERAAGPWVRRSSQKGIYALADANPAATLDGQAQGAYTVARTTCDEDEMMRYLRAARAFGRQRDEALVSTPPRAALAAAEEDAS